MLPPLHDPTSLYRLRDCLAAADCLGTAIVHLDLFGELARHPGTLDDLCTRLAIHRRPTSALLTLCAAHGLVERDAAGRYHPSGTALEFLIDGAPRDARAYYASMADRPGVTDFLRVLRTGRPAGWPGEEGEADWHAAMRTESFAASFTAAMDCRGRVLAPPLAAVLAAAVPAPLCLLDVGGGSGVYSIATVEQAPGSQATVLEAAPVDRIARETIGRAGLSDRIDVVTGDMFATPWPADRSLHLFSNVLHDWDEDACRRLLDRSAEALPPGGRIAIHDMFLDDDLAGPVWAAEYSVLLATVTQGRLYSRAEVGGWLADLGFGIEEAKPTALCRSVVIANRDR